MRVEAIFIADIHLSHSVPVWRSAEEDWYEVQKDYLIQLDQLVSQYHPAPLICAGDVFHRWNSPPELINLALRYMPRTYAIPGQHDLPHHSIDDIHKSAFWTLVQAGKITPLIHGPGEGIEVGALGITGFPWGAPLHPLDKPASSFLREIAVIHRYLWIPGKGHEYAPRENRLKMIWKQLKGYDVAVFGDNHIPFLVERAGRCSVVNCGAFMRRNSDQLDHRPAAWLLYSDGKIAPHYFDISRDKFIDYDEIKRAEIDGKPFVKFLERLRDTGSVVSSFEETVRHYLSEHDIHPRLLNR